MVQFNIPPANILHEVTGLVCFMVYQLLPAAWFIRWLVKRFGKQVGHYRAPMEHYGKQVESSRVQEQQTECSGQQAGHIGKQAEYFRKQIKRSGKQPDNNTPQRPQAYRLWPNVLLLLLTVGIVANANNYLQKDIRITTPDALAGYKGETVPGNVIKLSNDQVLIYIKPLAGFYSMEHHPMICWKGSGYAFKKVAEKDNVYQGILEKGQERLYTAWWYDNGDLSTTSQLSWRITAMSSSKKFSLINITAASPEALRQQIACFRQSNVLRQLQP